MANEDDARPELTTTQVTAATNDHELCSYWQRQAWRDADDHGFGFTPPLTEEQELEREIEDRNDPQCGHCPACNYWHEPSPHDDDVDDDDEDDQEVFHAR